MLRVQRERMSGGYFPTAREYTVGYGLTRDRLARCCSDHDASICHPGPMNRGLEIAADAADAAQLADPRPGLGRGRGADVRPLPPARRRRSADRPRAAHAAPPCTKECHEHRRPAGQGRRPRRSRRRRPAGARRRRRRGRARSPPPATPRSSTPTAWSRCPAWSTCTPTCASRAARTPRPSPPARPPRPSAASPRSSPWPTPPRSPTPPRRPSGSLDLGRARRPGRRAARRRGHQGPGRRGARRARADGPLAGAGAGLLRRRPLRPRRAGDAPGAGVRQRLRRRHLPARPGPAPGRRAPPAATRASSPAGSACRAGPASPRSRSSPATSCWRGTPARGCTSPTSPPPARSRSSAGPRQPGHRGHRRGHPAPPAADHRPARRATTPTFKVNPPLRPAEDVEALRAALADGTIDAVATDHAPHARHDKEHAFVDAAFGMLGLETALPVVSDVMVGAGPARLGRRRRG